MKSEKKRIVYSYDGLVQVITMSVIGIAAWIQPIDFAYPFPSIGMSILALIVIVRWIPRLRSPFIVADADNLNVHSGGHVDRIPMRDIADAKTSGLKGELRLSLTSGEQKVFTIPSMFGNNSFYKTFPEFEPTTTKKPNKSEMATPRKPSD